MSAVLETRAGALPCRRGKVRDVYDMGDRLVLVATDRLSAFDWVLPNGVPDKGRILTALSVFWFGKLDEPNHLLSTDLEEMGPEFTASREVFGGRSLLVRKGSIVPFECVVRGYLAGSGWKEYRASSSVCGVRLPRGLVEASPLPEPIFTPATKATEGHDLNVSFETMANQVGVETAEELRRRSLSIYEQAHRHAQSSGLLLADTKFEFARTADGDLILADEALTPDSSRYWPMDEYRPGGPQTPFDKQYVRDWLESVGFDKESPPPAMPEPVVRRTREKYVEAFERLTGFRFE